MRVYFASEMPYPYVPESVEQALHASRIIVPNSYCDPAVVSELYDRYLEEFEYADELGLDLALTEHHQSMTTLNVASPLTAAILARRTRRAQIAFVGISLPVRDNPVRVAEELAMLDCLSRGRIIAGFIRGLSTEMHPANTNPGSSREKMAEAHDLIVKAWTTPEPFSWEGRHWHYRYVNPWPRPYQQPHPPIWWTGHGVDNAAWAADHEYTFATFLSPFEQTEVLFNAYRERWRERGRGEAPPEKFAYMGMAYTAETDEQAQQDSRELLWGMSRTRHPNFGHAPGFEAPAVLARAFSRGPASAEAGGDQRLAIRLGRINFDALQAGGGLIVGSPATMIKKITYLYERYGIGHLILLGRSGLMPTKKVLRSLELFAGEVYPAVRELGAARHATAGDTTRARGEPLGVLA
jgi:alkanesulfonate monooxygenase SsuD/methylene tetrahydromethanopterin reductase-like flavin-dependent oxidoreductase (luciferase family)